MSAAAPRPSLWRRLARSFSALRTRVFLAVVAIGLLPVAVVLGWAILIEVGNTAYQPPQTEAEDVLRAWSGGEVHGVYHGSVVESDVAAMKGRLPSGSYDALAEHVATLMAASDSWMYSDSVPLAEFERDPLNDQSTGAEWGGDAGKLAPSVLAELQTKGYYWGVAPYSWVESGSGNPGDPGFAGVLAERDTPIVAWMPRDGVISYVQVQVSEGGPGQVQWWWFGLVAAIAVAAVVALAGMATLFATRGALKPLRSMAVESVVAEAGGDPQPVDATGPREVKDLARVFNGMTVRASRAQEAEQSFLLSVSHELKTPLTAIKGYAETLVQGRSDAKVAGEVIAREASRLQRLVQDVLDLGRAQKSTFSVRHEPVDLALVAREVYERYASRAAEYGVDLRVKAETSAMVTADGDRVVQVVSNLVENALRCTPEGTVLIAVGAGELRVSDTGPGLTRDDVRRAFERFYLYERYGKERVVGTGLGLAIVRDLTRAMGGEVRVESALGVGTTFVLTLPSAGVAKAE